MFPLGQGFELVLHFISTKLRLSHFAQIDGHPAMAYFSIFDVRRVFSCVNLVHSSGGKGVRSEEDALFDVPAVGSRGEENEQ